MSVQLLIKPVQMPSGAAPGEFPLDVDTSITVEELKEQVSGRVGLPKTSIRLVCSGRIWQDTASVGSYEPADGSVVHCLHNPPRGAAAAGEQRLVPVDPLQSMLGSGSGLGGTGGAMLPAGAAGGDSFQQMMAQAHQQMMANPEMMQQIMSSPMVQQVMSDPETMRAMVRMHPQLNDLMERRPEIARLLEDPEMLQQSMRMIANPSLMREMTRNADRAISQLDAMPGGHSALVRAHEEFADPLFEAMAGSGASGASAAAAASYAQQTEGGPNSAALPNPWGAPAPAPTTAAPLAAATGPASAPALGGLMPGLGGLAGLGGLGQAGQGAPANPMAAMMQQMMSNPAQMQQMMQMAQQMAAPAAAPPVAAAPGGEAPAANPLSANPLAAMLGMQGLQPGAGLQAGGLGMGGMGAFGANPMLGGGMMQQMMSNPAQMQQVMQLAQQLMAARGAGAGVSPLGPLFGNGALPTQAGEAAPGDGAGQPQLAAAMQRARFAAQLAQLSSMGFTNEAACLRALVQHGGRVDAAIDTLLSEGS